MSQINTFNSIEARKKLDAGIAESSIDVTQAQREKLINYTGMMAKWNHVYNLSAIRDGNKMVSHHLLDSLVILPVLKQWIEEAKLPKDDIRLLDVGTGGGLPGVVLAILQPTWQVTLIDPVHKKTAFLQQVKGQLALTNLSVITGKVEDLPKDKTYNIITSRAFASVIDFVTWSHSVLADNGFFAAMKGVFPEEEMTALNNAFVDQWRSKTTELTVPQLEAQRHLIQLIRI